MTSNVEHPADYGTTLVSRVSTDAGPDIKLLVHVFNVLKTRLNSSLGSNNLPASVRRAQTQ